MPETSRPAPDQPLEDWDAIVIGAGPAGALAARLLARQGCRTLLVERSAFPRDKVCGGCVNRRAAEQLAAVGLGDLPAAHGARPLGELRIYRGGQQLSVPVAGGLALSRRALDAALVAAAVEAGAEFRPQTTATVQPADGRADWRTLILQAQHGSPAAARARVVLAADGLSHTSLRQMPAFTSRIHPRAPIGLGAILPTAGPYSPGTVHMAVSRCGYAGLVRIENQQLNIAAAVQSHFVRRLGSPAAAIAAILREAHRPIPAELHDAAWQGTPALTRRTPQLAERRLFVLGDAAGYVEPFTGEGIAWALTGAAAVAPLAVQAVAGWDDDLSGVWQGRHRRLIGRRQRLCRTLAAVIQHPWAAAAAWTSFRLLPGLAQPLVRHLEKLPLAPETAR